MAELQIPDYMTTKPYGVADLYDIYDKTKANQQSFKMNEMKMAEAEQNAPIQRQVLEAQTRNYRADADLNAQKVHTQRLTMGSNIAKQILAQASKVSPEGTPEFDQAVQQYGTPMRPIIASAFGHQDDPSKPIDINGLKSLAGINIGGDEYHPPVPTSEGYLQFDNGQFAPMLNKQGKPYMPGAVDVGNKFDIGMADTLSKLVKDGYLKVEQAREILNNQVMSQQAPQQQRQPQRQPQVFIDPNMSSEDQALANQDLWNTYESNVAKQNQRVDGIPDAAQREAIKTKADIEKAVGVEAGKSQFEANRDLPAAIDQAANALDLIKRLKEHPGKAGFVGMPNVSGLLGGVRGTKEADFKSRLEQIKGQTFLQAFNSLKGAGQITEVEGQKATQAIARLDASQSEKEFDAALDDLSNIIDQGVVRAKTKAGGKNQSNNIKDDADAILRR